MSDLPKARIATASLAGCFGCHMALLDIDERLIELLKLVDFDRSPLTDIKRFTRRCDIGIIEGGCCDEENVHVLQDFRRNCDVLISLGQCAIMGGLPAMRNAIMHAGEPLRECLEEAYITGAYTRNKTQAIPNDPALPLLLDRVYPCSEVVEIDYQIHGTAAIPGGINHNLALATRDAFLKDVAEMRDWALDALALARDYTLTHAELVGGFANFPSKYMSLVRADDGALDLYHGNLRMIDPVGDVIFDQLPYDQYHEVLREDVRPWSYMKFPFIKDFGPDNGWYRVGPLARMNTVSLIDTPLANAARDDLMAVADGPKMHPILANHRARMIGLVNCVEKITELLHDPDLQGTDLKATGDRREEGIGVIEAPRGNLIHHYKVDENDQVTFCNLIVSTTHNNEGMNRAVKDVAVSQLSGQPEITEGMLNQVEVAIRAYDPCLSCATHALGQMPLQIELLDADGQTIDKRTRVQ